MRARPALHFTAHEGWINDPYGVTWAGGAYHLFYQALPGRAGWAPDCHWGHATAPDLVRWAEQAPALTPKEFELGCWSGCLVVDGTVAPTIFYTRVGHRDWGRPQIAIAHGGEALTTWTTGPDDVVVSGPPADLAVGAYRDPVVLRDADGWLMVLGAGLEGGVAAALQYRSADLHTWRYDGVLCSRSTTAADGVWTGSMWECPQLLPLGDRWVLLVSVWHQESLHYVAAAVGDYDGSEFAPRSWQRLTHGNSAYAMTAFTDRDGRRCVMSWLREDPRHFPATDVRAGAHSLAALLSFADDDRLVLRPHPDVDALRRELPRITGTPTRIPAHGRPLEVELAVASGGTLGIETGGVTRATLTCDPGGQRVCVERPGAALDELPLAGPAARVRVYVDADIVEVFTDNGYGAWRIPPEPSEQATELVVSPQLPWRAWAFEPAI